MGNYLSKPVCIKISNDDSNDKLNYGASSMQGWRLSQEDAHNSILDFDNNTSLFAVYDGHGGHEVAEYCANKLPDFLKALETYKSGDIEKTLVDGFLGFDATLTSAEVIAELREIVSSKPGNEEESDEDEENVSQLNQEAVMPLEEVMEKYSAVGSGKLAVAALKDSAGKFPVSPCLKARKSKDVAGGSGSSSSLAIASKGGDKSGICSTKDTIAAISETCDSSIAKNGKHDHGDAKEDNTCFDSTKTENNISECYSKDVTPDSKTKKEGSDKKGVKASDIKITKPESLKDTNEKVETSSGDDSQETKNVKVAKEHQNGEVVTPENNCTSQIDNNSPSVQENGDISMKGKGKALTKSKGICPPIEKKSRPKRTSQQMYRKLLEFEEESAESDDDEDKTFTVMDDNSDDSEQDVSNSAIELEEDSLDEDEFDEEDGEEEDEDADYDEEEDGDEDDGECQMFLNNMKSGVGAESGCTAVMALLLGNELYVANAGDSRCVVCRDGKAVEMSFDHKPEDALERARVEKAGGFISCDGRINGGLNLSRAIGDHAYKLNGDLTDREQLITALPDVKRLTIEPGRDEFLVLACDGIWNSMSSEEVVDFVRKRLQCDSRPEKLSMICEEMFDHCLAPNTRGDGTGCDNMTGIIVEFKPALTASTSSTYTPTSSGGLKRDSSPIPDEPSKRIKTDLPPTESNNAETSSSTSCAEEVTYN